MAEYIDREALIQELDAKLCALHGELDENRIVYDAFTDGFEECVGDVRKFQFAADVDPVVHGRWVHLGGDEWCCPVCGFVIFTEGSWEKPDKKYCEDCGAKMDGGDDV